MKTQIPVMKASEGEIIFSVDGEGGLTVCFVRDSTARCFVRIFAKQQPTKPVRVVLDRFFQGSTSEEFQPESFTHVGALWFTEKSKFPAHLVDEMFDKTVSAGVS